MTGPGLEPRTQAGRALLHRPFVTGQDHVRDAILAIEAEATAAPAADAWQAGYEACWNRLNDAGRLLPSTLAAEPAEIAETQHDPDTAPAEPDG